LWYFISILFYNFPRGGHKNYLSGDVQSVDEAGIIPELLNTTKIPLYKFLGTQYQILIKLNSEEETLDKKHISS